MSKRERLEPKNLLERDRAYERRQSALSEVTTSAFGLPADDDGRFPHELLGSLPVAVYTTDAKGKITYFNEAAVTLAGRTPALGSDEWCDQCPMAIALKEDRAIYGVEAVAEQPNGTRVPFLAFPVPLHDESGQVVGAINTLVDITERKRSEAQTHASEQRFRGLVSQVTAGIAETDLTGRFVHVNERYCEMIGYSPAELSQMRMQDITHPADLPRNVSMFEKLTRTGADFSIEKRYVRRDGSLVWVNNSVSGVRDTSGNLASAVAVSIDITERKHAEEALRAQTYRFETLNRIAKTLSSDLDLERIVQAVTDSATELSGAKFGAFFYNLVDEQGERYTLYTLSGAPRSAFERFGLPRNTAVFEPTFRGTSIVRSDDIRSDPRYGRSGPHFGMPTGHLPVVSYLAVPVVSRSGEVLGGLFFGHDRPGVFTKESEDIVNGIAAHAAIAIDNARLLQTAQTEIEQRTQAEAVQSAQRRVLELSVGDAPLAEVLNALLQTVEARSSAGMLGSILLLDADGLHLRHGAAPSLPEAYNQAIDGIAIGPDVGSCGTAAYSKQRVCVSDIANDPLWIDFRDLAAAHRLRACWSIPILSSQGDILGTFAMYYREARQPNATDLQLVEMALRTASLVIERERAEERRILLLREMNHRVKNLFAITDSFVTLSARSAPTAEDMARAIRGRIGALARAHELIRPSVNDAGLALSRETTLFDLVRSVSLPHLDPTHVEADQRLVGRGPHVLVGGNAVTGFALVLHELATNAVKYGALSVQTGSVVVDWTVRSEQILLNWTERNGPCLNGSPEHEGFGTRMSTATVTRQLGGEISYKWLPAGLVVHLSVPLKRLQE